MKVRLQIDLIILLILLINLGAESGAPSTSSKSRGGESRGGRQLLAIEAGPSTSGGARKKSLTNTKGIPVIL